MNVKSVLITGVAGLLGSNLANWIHQNRPDVEIIGIDDLSGSYAEHVGAHVKFYRQDLTQPHDIFERHRPEVVYHFAAYAAEALSPFIRRYNYTNNLVATAGVVSDCVKYGVKRLVFTSSMSVYGRGTPPFGEDAPLLPIDPYGVAKLGCELDVKIAHEQHGLDYCIIRPHNFYGPHQNIWDSYRNVLGIWMYKRLHGQSLTIYGDGQQVRAFSFIGDALPCFWRAGTTQKSLNQTINLGGIVPYSIQDAAETLISVTGGGELQYLPPRHEVKHAVPTWDRSVELLGFKHLTGLREGLTKMWAWAKTQPDRPRQVWNEYELEVGLYPYWNRATLEDNSTSGTILL